jgi:hypothetical protein
MHFLHMDMDSVLLITARLGSRAVIFRNFLIYLLTLPLLEALYSSQNMFKIPSGR